MALTRILGSAVRHPLATTALVAGVAKGSLVVVRRLARGENPLSPADQDAPAAASEPAGPVESVPEPQVVLLEPEDRDLPEPVVIHAEPEPEPVVDPEGHVELEEELVWTSESSAPTASE
jgi:hypothetical protein